MNLCDTCHWCLWRTWFGPLPEEWVVEEGDPNEPYFMKYCLILEYTVSSDETVECSHYRNKLFGGLNL